MASAGEPITLKLYGNGRYFQPGHGRYVTHDEVATLLRGGFAIVVQDAVTGADITGLVLFDSPTEH